MSILEAIFADKQVEVAARMAAVPLEDMRSAAGRIRVGTTLLEAIRRHPGPAPAVIAEIKRRSPSKGPLNPELDPFQLARTYLGAGAAAVSVLTDEKYFGGSLGDLESSVAALRSKGSDLPVLRKDFIYSEYQVYEARAAGAGAVLLIAAMLAPPRLAELIAETTSIGLTPLVEVHDQAESERALAAGARLIGINNRDLHTFEVNLDTTLQLRRHIPPEIPVVAESGIKHAEDVRRLADAGADAILVGEAFVTSGDPGALLAGFLEAGA